MSQTIKTTFYLPTSNNKLKKFPITIVATETHFDLIFGFHDDLREELKAQFENLHWCGRDEPPEKVWRAKITPTNLFKLRYFQNMNPYARFDAPLVPYNPTRNLYKHQIEMVREILTRHTCILACDMGLGKTLAAISAIEAIAPKGEIWYIGPVSAIRATELELKKWSVNLPFRLMTYDKMVSHMKTYQGKAPQVVIFDESSKLKTAESQRSQSARFLANAVRDEWGDEAYVIEMTGTPSPNNPVDWHNQCQTACPGFVREGDVFKFRARLAVMRKEENNAGGFYKIVTWRDDTSKCTKCGDPESKHLKTTDHSFEPCNNEIANLYNRLKGLVLVQLKENCLDLPEKIYESIVVRPNVETLRVLQSIKQTSKRAIEALTSARELSDGFQYSITKGEEVIDCPACEGKGRMFFYEDGTAKQTEGICPNCGGSGTTHKEIREVIEVPCPKDDILLAELDEHEEIGRYIVWAGFTGTIDRLQNLIVRAGWSVLRVDGRGYFGFDHTGVLNATELLQAMDRSFKDYKILKEKYPKICFLGQADAGGMGLTLTASPTMLYFSNSFKGESRMQSEDRAHRIGMGDKGLVIKDLIHLPTDKLVLENLKKKRDLQTLTMRELNDEVGA